MKWEHRCSLDWLRERQHHLTATDVKSLLPVTKTGRQRKVTKFDYMDVLAMKEVELTEESCMSYGAAARGHIMEPYAIETLNKALAGVETFYWWDDMLVYQPHRRLACSPDAMDVPMGEDPFEATALAEVKSYSPGKHLVTGYTPKAEIEERWQIACAMALMTKLDHAYLALYNPSMTRKLFIVRYERSDLEDEIEMVLKVEDEWDRFERTTAFALPPDGCAWTGQGPSESDIIAELEAAQRLNP